MLFRLEEGAVLAARGSGGIPVAVGQVFAGGFSLGIHVALDGTLLRGRIPVADVSIGRAVNFSEDASAVGGADTLDGVDHAARSVVGADFEIALEFHLAGLDAASTDPFAGTAIVTVIRFSEVITAFDTDGRGVVPDAGSIGHAGSFVAVAVFTLALAGTVLVLAHQVLDAGTSIINKLAHGVAAVALEVPHAVDVTVAGDLSLVLEGALLVASSSTDDAHFGAGADGEIGDFRAGVSTLTVGGVPHALSVFIAGNSSGVAVDTTFLADLSGVILRGGGDDTVGVLSTDIDLAVGARDAAGGTDFIVSAVLRGFAGTFSGLEVASLCASLGGFRPHASRISSTGRLISSVLDSAGLGASVVDTPLAHDGLFTVTLSSAETTSCAATNITIIEEAASISIARFTVFVLDFALEVASAGGGVPVAHGVRLARARSGVATASHLTLGSSGRPLAVNISIAVSNLSVGQVFVLALSVAATLGRRPVAHGSREAVRFVSHGGTFLTALEQEGIPHTLRIEVARSLCSVAVTTSLHTLLLDGFVSLETADGVGCADVRESARGVVVFILVESRALAFAFTSS